MPVKGFFDIIVRGHALPDSMKHHLMFEPEVDALANKSELCSNLVRVRSLRYCIASYACEYSARRSSRFSGLLPS